MFGPIIAAPLARPRSVTGRPSTSRRRLTTLGRVSVVMIAREASWNCGGDGSPDSRVERRPQAGLDLGHGELVADDAR